jgi:hypothetical protein
MRIELHFHFLLIGPIFSYLVDFIKIAFFIPYPVPASITARLHGNRHIGWHLLRRPKLTQYGLCQMLTPMRAP